MCDCFVEVSRTNQNVFAISESRRLRSSSSGIDEFGPEPMEVGAMKGKKGDKGKKGYGKGKYGKSFGKYDKNNENSKNNEYGTGSEKGKEKRKERQNKKTRKRREASTKFEFPGPLQVMWQVEAQGERVMARFRASRGGSSEFFREFSGAECRDHTCGCEDGSVCSRDQ